MPAPVAPHVFDNITVEELQDYSLMPFDHMGKSDLKDIFPVRGFQRHTGTYRVYEVDAFTGNMFKLIDDKGVAPRATWGHSTQSFTIEAFGLRDDISDRDFVNEEEAIDLLQDTALFLSRNAVNSRATLLAKRLLATGIWGTDLTGQAAAVPEIVSATAFQQFNEAASDPLAVIDKILETLQEATTLRGDTIIMGRQVMTELKRNPQIQQWGLSNPVGGIAGGVENTLAIISQYTGISVDRIYVVDVVLNDTEATDTLADATLADLENRRDGKELTQGALNMKFLVGKSMLILHIGDTMMGKRSQGAASEIQWTGLYPGGEVANYKTKLFYDIPSEVTWIEGRYALDFIVTAPTLGVFLDAVIA